MDRKLSDVAGVAVVGTLAAVVLGVRRGLVATAASFCALKAVPGVADAAAPVLGGVTARDRGDLVALAVLLPVALSLRRHNTCPVDDRRPAVPTAARRTVYAARRQLAAGASTVVPLFGAVAAVLVTTATSCAPEPAVTQVLARDGALYALVDNGDGTGRWAESTDGGRSWRRGRVPDGPGVAVPRKRYDETPPAGPLAGAARAVVDAGQASTTASAARGRRVGDIGRLAAARVTRSSVPGGATGVATNEVAQRCGTTDTSGRAWRRRFEVEGVDGVDRVAPGRSRRSWLPEGTLAEIVRITREAPPERQSCRRRPGLPNVVAAIPRFEHSRRPPRIGLCSC